jgi:hypothetical protein
VLGQLAHTGPVTLLAAGLERQQGQVLSEAVQDCVGGTFFICIDLLVIVDGLPCVVHGEPSAACRRHRQRPMQNQSASVQSAKPQEPRPRRRVAASFNNSMEPTGASRSGRLQVQRPLRLAPAAHAER